MNILSRDRVAGLRDAARLREKSIATAADELKHTPEVLSDQEIDKMSEPELQRYWGSFPTNSYKSHGTLVLESLDATDKDAALRNRLLAATALGVAALAAAPVIGVALAVVGGGAILAGTAFRVVLHTVESTLGSKPNVFNVGRQRTAAGTQAWHVRDEMASTRFGDSQTAVHLRQQDENQREQMLKRARQVDPKATPANLYQEKFGWLMHK